MKNTLKFLIIIVFISCTNKAERSFEYKPLSKFLIDKSTIKTGDTVTLFAFSGGKDDDKENIYYQQILVVHERTGDTLSIICPLLKIPSDEQNAKYIFISPLEYSKGSGLRKATYEEISDSLNVTIQMMSSAVDYAKETDEAGVSNLNELTVSKKTLVAVNLIIPDFKKKYKKVVGTLKFESDPR